MSNSVWGGLGNAPTFEKGTFFSPGGSHDVQIGRCLLKQSQQSGLGFIVESDILTTRATGEINHATNQPWVPLPAGVAGTWWQGMTDKNVALPAIKQFVFAILGLENNDPRRGLLEQLVPGSERWQLVDERGRVYIAGQPLALIEALMLWATSEANLFQGLIVHVDTKFTKTRKGGDFTIHNWTPINFAAMGLHPPNVDAILGQARNQPPLPVPTQQGFQQGPPGFGQPPAWGAPQGHPQQGFQQGFQQGPPPGFGQPQQAPAPLPSNWPAHVPVPPGFGQPQQAPARPQFQGQPPPGYGPPQQAPVWGQPQQAPAWGQPQQAPAWGAPQGQPQPQFQGQPPGQRWGGPPGDDNIPF